ncbi:DUF6443 domain-containing protein [Aestuariibaculum sp. M13]|uniref:DUF6443 domain-containing protein n=2 Tax=unclassified Aestuariibaculum TaxID=2646735 RepID=UPI002159E1B7|nr:DUF6443 domain-containing protein [Aestuariibaculum sp. M13]MCR8667506.1 DUF6443 domain-containing protein [Aestuariibaculum sp. M13]
MRKLIDYCKVRRIYRIALILFLFSSLSSYAQFEIVGDPNPIEGDVVPYLFPADDYGYDTNGWYFIWDVTDGVFEETNTYYYEDYDIPEVFIEWTTPGWQMIFLYVEDYNSDVYYMEYEVEVGEYIADPDIPIWNNDTCNPVLTIGNPPDGVTWYWQGKEANGTSTAKGSGSIYYPDEGSGIYYLRARNSSGTWSDNSTSVEIIVTPTTLWYTDTDNDGLGDPASTPISSCTKPSGRVSNNFDQCPTVSGNPLNNGCPGEGDLGSTDKNYVHTITPFIAVSNISQISNNADKGEDVVYYDGLGRTIQSVGIRSGGQSQDIKLPMIYDEFGRQSRSYLPYATTTSSVSSFTSNSTLISNLNSYYLTKYPSQLNSSTPNAYSETRFDASPLSRVLENGTPGEDWLINSISDSDHTTKYEYNTNGFKEIYNINYPGSGQSLSLSSYYGEGVLLKNTVKNANWVTSDGKVNTKDVFTDKGGKKIAEYSYVLEASVVKTLKTYYVYDNSGNLVYVLTPKLFVAIGSSTTVSVTNLNDLAFQYKYDVFNRQIEQKVPGKKQWEYMVYDQLDRPILTQDENLRASDSWLFTKYDVFGRVVYSGLFSYNGNRVNLQAEVDSYIDANSENLSNVETRTSESNIEGVTINYSNTAYPIEELEILTVNYYDDYTFTDADKPTTPTSVLGQTVTTRTKGLSTATWTKTLGSSTWTKSYTYYNEKGGVIKVYEKNHLGGYTDNQSKLDFIGRTENSTTTHRRGSSGSVLTIVDRFEYDHTGRPLEHYQTVNSNPEQRIAKHTYDELGQLVKKEIGGTGGSYLQAIDYAYDIRGALKAVNDVDNLGSDLFAYELNYESGEGTNYTSTYNQYNGNISQMVWKSAHNNVKKSYMFKYDKLNRLQNAYYGEGSSLNTNWNKFELSISGYDFNGNISSLTRKGGSMGSTIDNLTYYYDAGNQLMKIVDASGSSGFVNGTNTGDDYTYDDNGNLTKDLNKNITLIEYNHLDLVTKVTFGDGKRIEFLYDASGAKLQMKYVNGGSTTATDYIGGFQYQQSVLQFFPTPEGYVEHNGGIYNYVYSIKDHLGNVRISFKDGDNNNIVNSSDILSNTDYYPMGMPHYGEYAINSTYNFKYQGKELLKSNKYNMYDFGSRMYDPSVGRWFNTDPQNQFGSPYLAMGNNWVVSVDPNGEFAFVPILAAAMIGGMISGVQTDMSGGDFLQGFVKGAIIGGVTSVVGQVANGLNMAKSLGVGFFRGAYVGASGGAAGGLTSGILDGNDFEETLISGGVGLISGGGIGGLASGITAANHGGNFWTGHGATFEVPAFNYKGENQVGEGMEYTTEYGKGYLDYFPDMEHPYRYYADGTAPKGYIYNEKNGVLYSKKGTGALAVTRYDHTILRSDMYMGRAAFVSKEALYLTTGHELMHIAHFSAGLFSEVKGHNSIYDWQYQQAKAWGLHDMARSYKSRILPGFFNRNYDWNKYCIGICPTKGFLN